MEELLKEILVEENDTKEKLETFGRKKKEEMREEMEKERGKKVKETSEGGNIMYVLSLYNS